MSASDNAVSLSLVQKDSNAVAILNRQIGPVDYQGTVGGLTEGILLNTSLTALTLPTANVLQVYFKNLHASAVITITATVQGGASQVVKKVQPGSVFLAWDSVTSATAGYTAISLTSDTANAPYELFLGG